MPSARMPAVKIIPRPPQKCIFCGGGNMSREHIYADWMRPYLRVFDSTTHYVNTQTAPQWAQLIPARAERGKLHLKGDHRSRKLRVVCVTCNTTWMSRLQTAAKPVLLPFLTGSNVALSRTQQRAAANWAAMFTMVYEFADPLTIAIPQSERASFMRILQPNANWLIWVAPFVGKSYAGMAHHRGIGFLEQGHREPSVAQIFNTQVTVGSAGGLFFLTCFSSNSTVLSRGFPAIRRLCGELMYTRVWPTVGFHQKDSGVVDDFLVSTMVDAVSAELASAVS